MNKSKLKKAIGAAEKSTNSSSGPRSVGVATGSPTPRVESEPTTVADIAKLVDVDPARVRKLLERGGRTTHRIGCDFFGVNEDAWPDLFRFSPEEEAEAAELVATVIGRHRRLAPVAAVVAKSDELLLLALLADALVRNWVDSRAAIAMASAGIPDNVEVKLGFDNEAGGVPVFDRNGEGDEPAEVDRARVASGPTEAAG